VSVSILFDNLEKVTITSRKVIIDPAAPSPGTCPFNRRRHEPAQEQTDEDNCPGVNCIEDHKKILFSPSVKQVPIRLIVERENAFPVVLHADHCQPLALASS
jgi:hypothetical protein